MSNTPQRSAVTTWLLALLNAQMTAPEVCGDARAQVPEVLTPDDYPYWVLFSIPGGSIDGPPLGQAQGDARFLYQLDAVGLNRDQAEKAADRSREWVVGRTPAGIFVVQATDPDGHVIHDRIVDGTPGAPLQEGQPPNEVFTVSDTFGIDVSVK